MEFGVQLGVVQVSQRDAVELQGGPAQPGIVAQRGCQRRILHLTTRQQAPEGTDTDSRGATGRQEDRLSEPRGECDV